MKTVNQIGFLISAFLAYAPVNTLIGQQPTTWMSVGSFQNWYAGAGCEIEEGRAPNMQDGFQWSAPYSHQDMQVAKGLWIGTTNYQERSTLYPYKVVHVGPRVAGSGEFFPQVLEVISRFPPPDVRVNGNPQALKPVTIARVDPALPCDRMVLNVASTPIGITMTRRILGFSQQYHDNYAVSEYTFRNDSGKTLTGLRFFFQYRMAICGEASIVIGNPTSWGFNTMLDTRGDSVKNDADDFEQPGNPSTHHMRIQYAWHGRFPAFNAYDNIGGPIWVPNPFGSGDPADTTARLTAAQFAGFVTLHADRSAADSGDDPSQPSTTGFIGSDDPVTSLNSQFDATKMQQEYVVMSYGHKSPRHADRVQPDGKFDQQTGDPSMGTTGGFSATNGYGPYTLPPGDSIRIIMAEGASGLSRDRCISICRQFKSGSISAQAKNDSVLTGKDSLFQTFRRAIANYRNGWSVPQPPLPPQSFTVTSGTRGISLSWDLFSLSGPTIAGFRIYRSVEKYSSPDSLIYTPGPGVRSYIDSLVVPGAQYYYYIQAVGSPAENSGSAMTPPGIALASNRMYTQTVEGAALLPNALAPEGPGVPSSVVLLQNYPNPFNPTTSIGYQLPAVMHVTLSVFNNVGQRIVSLVDGEQGAGVHSVQFDGSNLASGVYYYQLRAGFFAATRMLVLVR